jgi:hypothetical protein
MTRPEGAELLIKVSEIEDLNLLSNIQEVAKLRQMNLQSAAALASLGDQIDNQLEVDAKEKAIAAKSGKPLKLVNADGDDVEGD